MWEQQTWNYDVLVFFTTLSVWRERIIVNRWKISGLRDQRVAQDINLVNAPPLPYAVKIVVKIILYSEEQHIIMLYLWFFVNTIQHTLIYCHQCLIIHLRTKMENKTAKLLSNHTHTKICSFFFAIIIISSCDPCNINNFAGITTLVMNFKNQGSKQIFKIKVKSCSTGKD